MVLYIKYFDIFENTPLFYSILNKTTIAQISTASSKTPISPALPSQLLHSQSPSPFLFRFLSVVVSISALISPLLPNSPHRISSTSRTRPTSRRWSFALARVKPPTTRKWLEIRIEEHNGWKFAKQSSCISLRRSSLDSMRAIYIAPGLSHQNISESFKALAATVNAENTTVEVALFSRACSFISPLFDCLGIAFKFAEMDCCNGCGNPRLTWKRKNRKNYGKKGE
uniref:Uncharacterized protein n=1 Tax=Cucumis melo TaxID=3656 RepID=A0A9I9EB38_CUCME